MEPSFIISKQKDQTKTKSESKKFIDCPNGTVPILKNTKEFVTNAQYWANKHFNSFTIDSHGTHFAGVRASQDQGPYHGVEAWMSVHELNISVDQTSYTNIYVASAVSDKVNFIQTGWMVNPTLFGDGRPWSYGLWKGINRTGCYNTICPGFIQVSKTDPLSIPLSPLPKGEIGTYLSIKQDKETGNWWAADVKYNGHGMNIGYWPKELFDLISTNAGMVGVTGAVQASPSGKSPPMGNGYLPTKNEMGSARVRDANIIDSNFKVMGSKKYKLEKILDSDKCYGLRDGRKKSFDEGTYVLFTYGGPGGDSCGV